MNRNYRKRNKRSVKRVYANGRNYLDPKYKTWRRKVYKRDSYKCQFPGCKTRTKRVEAHHIRKWANYHHLRYITKNGISLCRSCHKRVTGFEEYYHVLFDKIIRDKDE